MVAYIGRCRAVDDCLPKMGERYLIIRNDSIFGGHLFRRLSLGFPPRPSGVFVATVHQPDPHPQPQALHASPEA